MACVSKKTHDEPSYGFNKVPNSLDDVTAEWCEDALKNGNAIGTDTKILSIEVKQLQNVDTGVMDGGGFSGSCLVRVENIQYSGNVTGNEPNSLVCKLSLGSGYSMPFWLRAIVFLQNNASYDEFMYSRETYFIQNVLPLLKDSGYAFPEIYFSGINDEGATGFTGYVILGRPTKMKSIALMEDMAGWTSGAVGKTVTKEQAILCFKNAAVLHAKFWGYESHNAIKTSLGVAKPEKDFRPACHYKFLAKMRNRAFKSPEVIQNNIDKMFASEWIKGDRIFDFILNLVLFGNFMTYVYSCGVLQIH